MPVQQVLGGRGLCSIPLKNIHNAEHDHSCEKGPCSESEPSSNKDRRREQAAGESSRKCNSRVQCGAFTSEAVLVGTWLEGVRGLDNALISFKRLCRRFVVVRREYQGT